MQEDLLKLPARCPSCLESLMHETVVVDAESSVELLARVGRRLGHIHLSQLYGSFHKLFVEVEDIPGTIAGFSCPRCLARLPVHGLCPSCRAPMVAVDLLMGGYIRICSRNGCKHHALELENRSDVFRVYEAQHPYG